ARPREQSLAASLDVGRHSQGLNEPPLKHHDALGQPELLLDEADARWARHLPQGDGDGLLPAAARIERQDRERAVASGWGRHWASPMGCRTGPPTGVPLAAVNSSK